MKSQKYQYFDVCAAGDGQTLGDFKRTEPGLELFAMFDTEREANEFAATLDRIVGVEP